MSLLFDHALSTLDLESQTHYTATDGDFEPTGEAIPVRPIVEFAAHHALEHPDLDPSYTCVPLHGETSAALTGSFLAYASDSLRGEIIIYRRGDKRSAIDVDEFAKTQLARRIRFWHSDYRPDSYPPGYDRPVDDNEQPRNPVDPEAFLDGLETAIREERAAIREARIERAKRDRNGSRGPPQNGESAIPSMTYIDRRKKQVRFKVAVHGGDGDSDTTDTRNRNPTDWSYYVPKTYGIYQGNEVLIYGSGTAFPVRGVVENIHGLELTVGVDWESVASPTTVERQFARSESAFGLSLLLNPVPTDRELAAVEQLRAAPLAGVLTGSRPITFTNGGAARSEPLDTDLNQEQQLAVELALLADDFFCIHGPPGTGKTRTLIEIIRRAVQAGQRVLVCADSNQAVDNILIGESTPEKADPRSLHAYGQYETGELIVNRINGARRPTELVKQYGTVSETADVVAATNNSSADVPGSFDLLVLDEATQSTCASSCIPLANADRVVLAGDHKQLPPFSSTEDPPKSSLGLSLFEHLYADGGVYEDVGVTLTTQYRMHRDIAWFSNREFYHQKLRNGLEIDPLPKREHAIEAFDIGGSVTVEDHSRSNENEAKLIAQLTGELLAESGLSPDEIGVITPYSAQVTVIRNTLRAAVDGGDGVTVDTIDSFQGGEREAILISLVRSNSSGEIGFLGRPDDGPRRLNVALTRAKRYCAVIGDFYTFRQDVDGTCTDLYTRLDSMFTDTKRKRQVDPAFLTATVDR